MSLKSSISGLSELGKTLTSLKRFSSDWANMDSKLFKNSGISYAQDAISNLDNLQDKIRTLSMAGFSEEQIKATLATKNLTEEVIQQNMAAMGLSKNLADLTAKQKIEIVQSVASAKGKKDEVDALLKEAGLLGDIANLTDDEIRTKINNVQTTQQVTKATKEFTLSQLGLANASKSTINILNVLKGLGAELKATFLSLSLVTKVLVVAIAALAIFNLIVKAVNYFNTSLEELQKTAQDSASKLQETTQELESLQSELETTEARIKELESAPSLTLVEENELAKLKVTQSQLENLIKLKEQAAEQEAKTAVQDAANVLNTEARDDFSWTGLFNKGFDVFEKTSVLEKGEEYLSEAQETQKRIEEANTELAKIMANGTPEQNTEDWGRANRLRDQIAEDEKLLEEQKENLTTLLSENSEYITTIAENNFNAAGEVINEGANNLLNQYQVLSNGISLMSSDEKYSTIQDLVEDIYDSKTSTGYAKNAAEQLINLDSVKLEDPKWINDIDNWVEEVQADLSKKGYEITVDDIKIAFNIDEESTIENAKEQLGNNLDSAGLSYNLNIPKPSNLTLDIGTNISNSKAGTKVDRTNELRSILLNSNNSQLSTLQNIDWSDKAYQNAVQDFTKIKQLVKDTKSLASELTYESLFEDWGTSQEFIDLENQAKKFGTSIEEIMSTSLDENGYIDVTETAGELVRNYFINLYEQINQVAEESTETTAKISEEATKNIAKSFSDMWSDEDWQEANSDLVTLAKQSNVTAQDIEELAQSDDKLAYILEQQGMTAQFAASCLNKIGAGGSAFDVVTQDALNLNLVLNDLAEAFTKADEARSKYQSAMEQEDYNAGFQDRATAFDGMMEMFEHGEYGKQFWASAEYFFGEDAYEMSIDQVYKKMVALDSVFDDVESNGIGALKKLAKLDLSKYGIKDSYVTKLDDGSYDFDIQADELDKLAKAAGMSEEALTDCLEALGMFGTVRFYNLEDLESTLKELNIGLKDSEGNVNISRQALEGMLADLGYTGREAYMIIKDIMDMDGVKVIDFDVQKDDIDSVLKSLKQLDVFEGFNFSKKNFNIDTFVSTLHDSLGMSGEDISTFVEKLNEAGYKFIDLEGNAIDAEDAITKALSAGQADPFTTTVEEATTSLNELKSVAEELDDSEYKTKLLTNIDEYEAEINKAEESGLGVPTEIVTQLKFEIDKADLLEKIEEAKKTAQWAQEGSEQRKEANLEILSTESQYAGLVKDNIGMNQHTWSSSIFGQLESNATTMAQEGNQEDAVKTMEFLREILDEFTSLNPEINFETNTKEATNELLEFTSQLESAGLLEITPDMDTEELTNVLNTYRMAIDGANALGIEINFDNPEEAKQQIESIESTYNQVANYLEGKGIHVDLSTEEGRSTISSLLEEIPEEIKTSFNADPTKFLNNLDQIIQIAEDGEVHINVEAFTNLFSSEVEKAKDKAEETVITPIDANASEAISKVNGVKKDAQETVITPLNMNTFLANQTFNKFASGIERKNISTTITPVINTNTVANALENLTRTRYVTIQSRMNTGGASDPINGSSVNGTAHVLGTAYASGRWGIPKAEKSTLIGELGPELMVNPNTGTYTTLGDYGPELVDLPKNAIIFNHKQTKSILENGYALGRGKVVNGSSNAIGTAYASGTIKKTTYKNTSNGVSSSNKYSSSSSSSKSSNNSSNSSNSSSSSSSSTANEVSNVLSEAFDKFFDWIEIRVETFERNMSYYEAKASNYVSYTNQNKMVDKQISALKSLITTDQKGYSKYMAQASKVLTTSKKSLTSKQMSQVNSAVKTLKNGGTINISSYSEGVRTVIEEYKEWYDKAKDLSIALEENKAKLQELAATKLENIQTYYTNRIDYRSTNTSNKEAYVDYVQSKNNYSLSSSSYKNTAHYNAIRDAYKSIISDSIANEKYLREERSKLQSQLNSEVKKGNIKKYSDIWYEWQNNINALSAEIYEASQQTQEYYKSLYDLPLEKATQAVEKLNKALDLLESKASVVSAGSNTYNRVLASDAKTAVNSRASNVTTQKNDLTSAASTLTKTLNNTKTSSAIKTRIKTGIKNNSSISTSGLSGALLTAVNAYNSALTDYKNAVKEYNSVKASYDQLIASQKSDSSKYNYQITNDYLDQEIANMKQQNADYQSSLRTANASLYSAQVSKTSQESNLEKKASALLKYTLSSSQKAAVNNRTTVSTSGLSGNALSAAQAYNSAVQSVSKATIAYNAALASQKEIAQEAAQAQIDYAETLQNVAKEAFDNVVAEFDSLCSKIASEISLLNDKFEYLQNFDGSYYDQRSALLSIQKKTTEQAEKQYEAIQKAQEEYDARKANMTDEDRISAQSDLNDMWSEYYSLLSQNKEVLQQILELNNQIAFDNQIDDLEITINELDSIRDLMSTSLVDSNGFFTSAGVANIAMIGEAIADCQEQIGLYQEKLEVLNSAYKRGILNEEEYAEVSKECRDAIFDNAKAVQEYKNELINLYKEQMSNELDALNEVINKRKEALQSMKDYHDYADSIKDQNKDIESLEAQIAVLENVDDQNSKAQLAQLKAQLKEAQDDLDDTVEDHRLDVLTSGLDKLSEDAQEAYDATITALEESADKQEQIVNEMLAIIKSSYKEAYEEIGDIIDEFGLRVSESTQEDINIIKTGNSSAVSSSTSSNAYDGTALTSQSDVSAEALKDSIQNFINSLGETTRTQAQLKDLNYSSDLYSYVGLNYGKNLTLSDMCYLGSLLGVQGLPEDSSKLSKAQKTEILNAFKNAGFSSGGIIKDSFTPINSIFDVIKTNGDNSLVVGARSGESILTEQFTDMLPRLLENIDLFNGTFDAIKNMNFSAPISNQPVEINVHYDNLLNVEGNVDKDTLPDLKTILEKSCKFTTDYMRKELKKIQ